MNCIDLIAGARPNFMKIAAIIDALKAAEGNGGALRYRLIRTGQHYDTAMSGNFFKQLGIPEPDINLEVGSGTQAEQTAAIMVRYEKVPLEQRSDLYLVGGVTSTIRRRATSSWPDAVFGETSVAAQVVVLGVAGAWVVHAY